MPGDAISTHPNGVLQIRFTESSHEYQDSDGMHYQSATSFKKHYFPAFDPTGEITERCAAKRNVTPEQLRAEWKAKGAASCRYGTRVHENGENHVLKRFKLIHTPESEKEAVGFNMVRNECIRIMGKFTFVATEQIVFSPSLALAGSIDLLVADHPQRVLWILDWKTNERIDRVSAYGSMALEPIAYISACHFSEYTIQLGIYERIIKAEGYLDAAGMAGYTIKRAIIHLDAINGVTEWIDLPDSSREVAEMIIDKFTNLPF